MNLNVCLKKANSIQWNGMNFLTAACLLLAFACFNHYFIFLTSAVIYLNQHIHQIYLIYYLISSLLAKTVRKQEFQTCIRLGKYFSGLIPFNHVHQF